MKCDFPRFTKLLVTASLAMQAQWAVAQIAVRPRDIALETGVWTLAPGGEMLAAQVNTLRNEIVKEFSRGSRQYERLDTEFAVRKGWLIDSRLSREKIALISEPTQTSIYGSFSIYLKKISYHECTSLINDDVTLARFDGVWLNEQPVGVRDKPQCAIEWPFQAGKNTLRYHTH